MESTLGQPLRASITYALNPNEQLHDYCIYLRPVAPGGPIPSVTRASLAVSGNRIIVTGSQPVMDPLLNLQLTVDCPYTPNLVREYTMIVDPVLPAESAPLYASAQPANTSAAAAAGVAVSPGQAEIQERTARAPISKTPLVPGSEYRVQPGDTASTIAARIENRSIRLPRAVDMLVATNPGAFIRGNADRIMAGSLLIVPEMTGSYVEPSVAAVETAAVDTIVDDPGTFESFSADLPADVAGPELLASDEPGAVTEAPFDEPATPVAEPFAETSVESETVSDASVASTSEGQTADERTEPTGAEAVNARYDGMKPGDIIAAPPVDASAAPVVVASSVTSNNDTRETSGAWSQLALVAGAGLALLTGLLFFGRRLRNRFGSVAINAPAPPERTEETTAEKRETIVDDVDFRFDDTISEEALSLDADLGAGTGLGDSGDLDVSQEFTFDSVAQATRDIDLEITAEAAAEPEQPTTDIIPPNHKLQESTILEDEVVPESDDYDMSMIVDATKQSIDYDDATARDLQAVPVGNDLAKTGEYAIADDTMATEADLKALELDYEEEFTQTQALNKEIEQAARDLAARLDPAELAEALDSDPGLELTAEMPANNAGPENEDAPPQDGDEVTAELTANLPVDVDAVNDDIAEDDITSKMLAAGSDVTVEMQIESGTVDTKKDT